MQHYEGASTPYGPHTLEVLQQEFKGITRKEDQYIDCENRSGREVKFEVSYSYSGKKITHKMSKTESYFRFSIPFEVGEYKLRANYKTKNKKWKSTTWLKQVSSGVGSATHIIFNDNKIGSLGQVVHKTIRCSYSGNEYVNFICTYKNRRNKDVQKESTLVQSGYFDFEIPWNATTIRVKASLQRELVGPKRWTEELIIELGSHEEIFVDLKHGGLVELERWGPWW